MARTRVGLSLTKEEETKLEEWCQERTTSTRLQFRAAIVLEHARGDSVEEIAKRHQTSERTVLRWRQRFANNRLAGLVAKQVSTVSRKAGGSVAGGGKAVAGKLAEAGAALAKKAADVGGVIADAGAAGAKKAADVGGVIADAGAAGAKKAAGAGAVIVDAGAAGAKMAAGAAILAAEAMQAGFRKTLDTTLPVANWLSATAQGLLASNLANDLNGLLQDMVKGPPTIYDKAMDAVYNETPFWGS